MAKGQDEGMEQSKRTSTEKKGYSNEWAMKTTQKNPVLLQSPDILIIHSQKNV